MFCPRFEFILLQNVQSIRDCEPQKLGHIDVRPHYVCVCRHFPSPSCIVIMLPAMGGALSDTAICLCLSQPRLLARWLPAACRPPEMCRLWTHLWKDVDPPWVELPSAGGISSRCPQGYNLLLLWSAQWPVLVFLQAFSWWIFVCWFLLGFLCLHVPWRKPLEHQHNHPALFLNFCVLSCNSLTEVPTAGNCKL